MSSKITFKGNPLTLTGNEVKVGDKAPDFTVTSVDLNQVKLDDFKDKVKILTTFPSLDTPVCDLQVKEFNKRAASLADDVVVIGVSKDLPFAQKRFCDANSIENVVTVSDYKDNSFGNNYGLLIKELQLLARAIIIVDKSDIIQYIQIVSEVTDQPDYEDALNNLGKIS